MREGPGVLHIHRAERTDALVAALAQLLADPPADPFAREVVAVPTRGMERWLTQRLSAGLGAAPGRADGICANVAFPSPRRLTADAVAAATGIEPDDDPWLVERIAWPLLEVVDEALGEPWLRALAAHLGAGNEDDDAARRARRLSSVRRIAELYDRYALHRPAMLCAWAAGRDEDGEGGVLAEDVRWQPELWRRLRERVGRAGPRHAAGRRLPAAVRGAGPRRPAAAAVAVRPDADAGRPAAGARRARARARRARLRPASLAGALDAPGRGGRKASPRPRQGRAAPCAGGPRPVRRAADITRHLPVNRLLASWGQDARELQLVLGRRRRAERGPPSPAGLRSAHAAAAHPGRRARRSRAARRAGRAAAAARRGPQRAGPRLSRPRPPGRGAARRDPAPARRGPDDRAARRHRDVPRHRDVRAADPGDVRRRAGRRRRDRAAAGRRAAGGAARAPRRPIAAPDEPDPRRRRRAARARRRGASRRRRCSTSPTARPCAAASASTTTTSRGSRTGSPTAGSAGGWMPRTGARSSSTRSTRGRGGRAWTGCCSASR